MGTKIEILALTPERASLAFYYIIASPIAAADDPTRTPAGTRLSVAEQQDLKDGKLFEVLMSATIGGLSKAAARTVVQTMWVDHEAEALVAYTRLYSRADLIGMAWDGARWS